MPSTADTREALRVSYGLDAPPVVAGFVAAGILGTVFLLLTAFTSAQLLGPGLGFFTFGWLTAAAMLHSSLRGKIVMRERVLDRLAWPVSTRTTRRQPGWST